MENNKGKEFSIFPCFPFSLTYTMELKIYIDGASRGNPGPAGIGIVVENFEGKVIHTYRKYIGKATNNVAEYKALIEALRIAKSLGGEELWIYSDSDLLVNQLNERYRVKNETLRKLCKQAVKLKGDFKRVEFLYINRKNNKQANKLSQLAIDLK